MITHWNYDFHIQLLFEVLRFSASFKTIIPKNHVLLCSHLWRRRQKKQGACILERGDLPLWPAWQWPWPRKPVSISITIYSLSLKSLQRRNPKPTISFHTLIWTGYLWQAKMENPWKSIKIHEKPLYYTLYNSSCISFWEGILHALHPCSATHSRAAASRAARSSNCNRRMWTLILKNPWKI